MFNYLRITNGSLNQTFDNHLNTYYVTVDENTTELEFDYELTDNTKLTIIGNDSFKEGTNYLFLECLKDNKLMTYTFIVDKSVSEVVSKEINDYKALEVKTQSDIPYLVPKVSIVCLFFIIILFYLFFIKKRKINK